MKSFWQNIRKSLAIKFALGIFIFFAFVCGMVWFAFGPLHDYAGKRNTQYSSAFSPQKFNGITNGEFRSAVIDILGTPMQSDIQTNYPVWALRDEKVRSRLGKENEVKIEFLYFSKPKELARDYDKIEIIFGPDSTVVDKERWVTD